MQLRNTVYINSRNAYVEKIPDLEGQHYRKNANSRQASISSHSCCSVASLLIFVHMNDVDDVAEKI